jgi:hypothetical protein
MPGTATSIAHTKRNRDREHCGQYTPRLQTDYRELESDQKKQRRVQQLIHDVPELTKILVPSSLTT